MHKQTPMRVALPRNQLPDQKYAHCALNGVVDLASFFKSLAPVHKISSQPQNLFSEVVDRQVELQGRTRNMNKPNDEDQINNNKQEVLRFLKFTDIGGRKIHYITSTLS